MIEYEDGPQDDLHDLASRVGRALAALADISDVPPDAYGALSAARQILRGEV